MKLDENTQVGKIVTLDFYDGAVGGFVELIDTGGEVEWYQYELVAWDNHQKQRIFCVAPALVDQTLKEGGVTTQGRYLVPETNPTVADELDRIRRARKDFVAVLLSDSYLNQVTAIRFLTPEIEQRIPSDLPSYDDREFHFWIAELRRHN
jgi:hypothetical protein